MMNSWLYAMIVVGYMLLMIIHDLGDDKCVVVVKVLCFYDFYENGLKRWEVWFLMNLSGLMKLLRWIN